MKKNKYSRLVYTYLLGQFTLLFLFSCSNSKGEKNSTFNAQHFLSLNEIRSIDSLKNLSHQLKRKIEEKTKKLEKLKEDVVNLTGKNISNSFEDQSTTLVKSPIAYLKKYPSEIEFDKTKFIAKGDEVFIVRIKENHGYVEYLDPITESTLKGWIDLRDLEPNANTDDDN